MRDLQNKHILLGVTGGIAAYKSAELLRRLQDAGATVRVVMTRGATEFITPLTMQALSGLPVSLDLLDTETESVMGHIELARWADLILIAPASAHFLAGLRLGRAAYRRVQPQLPPPAGRPGPPAGHGPRPRIGENRPQGTVLPRGRRHPA